MCTVTYLPTDTGFILSSNRDESPLRSSTPITEEKIGNANVIYPKDTKGGSWFFISDRKQVVCVLNGAQEKHHHRPPYRMSRGLLAKSFFHYRNARYFFQHVNVREIEPFTMIIYSDEKLYQFRWDEHHKYIDVLDATKSHIWSSSTLYDRKMRRKRQEVFQEMLLEIDHSFSLQNAVKIHRQGRVGNPRQDYIMNRDNIVRTVSISHVVYTDDGYHLEVEDLLGDKVEEVDGKISKAK